LSDQRDVTGRRQGQASENRRVKSNIIVERPRGVQRPAPF
jgi:hypothetical protein